jgi:RNA polymerase sigma factor (TIGR02999 family)
MPMDSEDFTASLKAWSSGDRSAFDRLVEHAYPELRLIAGRYLRRERPGHTLQCTAVIHEAYLRLVQAPAKDWNSRTHFFGFTAQLMRTILVDYARARRTAKRGAGGVAVTVDESPDASSSASVDVLDLHFALDELEQLDPQQARLVDLRYFAGLSIEETAAGLEVSPSTVKREWLIAKTWIRRRLNGAERRG